MLGADGRPAAATSVDIFEEDGSTRATWYTTESGGAGSTAAVVTDSGGRIDAWVEEGTYVLSPSGGEAQRYEAVRGQTILGRVNVKSFGATGDGTTDDTAAFQAALDSLPDTTSALVADEEVAGGEITVPGGIYRITAPLIITKPGTRLVGTGREGTYLLIDHDDGAGVWIQQPYCALKSLRVFASTTREAAAIGTGSGLNCGIRIEPPDVAAVSVHDPAPTRMVSLEDGTSTYHPGPGVVISSHGPMKTLKRWMIGNNGSHGLHISNGVSEGYRTNLLAQASGFVDLQSCTINNNQGHSIAMGHPDDDGLPLDDDNLPRPIARCTVQQLDSGGNVLDPSLSLGNPVDNIWVRGQDITIENSGCNGRMSLWGRNIDVRNIRNTGGSSGKLTHAGVTAAVHVTSTSTYVTRGVRVQDMHPIGANCDPLVLIDSDVEADATQVLQAGRTNVSSAVTDGMVSFAAVKRGLVVPSGYISHNFTLNDDKAAYLEFTNVVTGSILLDARTGDVFHIMAAFRAGDGSAFCRRLSQLSASLATATAAVASAPTGTTGTDGNLTITVITDSNRLYIENRSGSNLSLSYTLLNVLSGIGVTGPPVVLP